MFLMFLCFYFNDIVHVQYTNCQQNIENEHPDNLTLKTQLEWIFINAGLLHSSNISSNFMPLTTDGQTAILLMSKLP